MLRFSGHVAPCAEGYVWENQSGRRPEDGEERYAKGLVLKPMGSTFEIYYDPFVAEPALFRIFAALSPTPDAISTFADRYGDIARVGESMQRGGRSLWDWRGEISRFREKVTAADRLLARRDGRRTPLRQTQDIAIFIEPLLLTIPVFMSAEIQGGVIDLRANVLDLMDVITIQLVEAVVERKSYRTCDYCGKPFEVTPQINRSDRIFCSDNCRVKAYQRRRKQAIAMRAKGETLREIVKALGSDLPTVKKWVGEAKKEK